MLTANEIANMKFDKSKMGGYKTTDVDNFVIEVDSAFSQLNRETADVKRKLEAANKKISDFENDRVSLSEALFNAQRLADTVIRDAQSKADLIIKDAEIKSDKIKENVKAAIIEEQSDFTRLKNEISRFKHTILDLYKEQIEKILKTPEASEQNEIIESPQSISGDEVIAESPEIRQEEIINVANDNNIHTETQIESQIAADAQRAEAAADTKSDYVIFSADDYIDEEEPQKEEKVKEEKVKEDKIQRQEYKQQTGRDPEIKLNLKFDEETGEYSPVSFEDK